MILEFKCSNFRSINSEIDFNMQATKDDSFAEQLIDFDSKKFLRHAEIYGGNGVGKTTLLRAIARMSQLVRSSYHLQPGDLLPQDNHKLNPDNPTYFSLWFEKDDIKYFYEFSYTEKEIVEENFYYSPNGRMVEIFERTKNEIEIGNSFEKDLEDCKKQLKENKLFLSIAANIVDVEPITNAFMFFKEDIIFYDYIPLRRVKTAQILAENESLRKRVVAFMKSFCLDLEDIIVKVEKINFDEEDSISLPEKMSSELRERLHIRPIITFKYKDFSIDIREESSGIQKIFEYITPVIEVVDSGKVFLCDEIERSLHPKLVEYLLTFFIDDKTKKAQAIFTSHDMELLDLSLLRRDQVWFANLKQDGRETEIYSLAELNDVRKGENIRKGYLENRYGALPLFTDEK